MKTAQCPKTALHLLKHLYFVMNSVLYTSNVGSSFGFLFSAVLLLLEDWTLKFSEKYLFFNL